MMSWFTFTTIMIAATDGGTYDAQATPHIHPRGSRSVPPRLGSGRGGLPDDIAYTVVRIRDHEVGLARGVAGPRSRRGFVLFEDVVQRDMERTPRLDRAPRPQTCEITATHHRPRLQELRRRMGPFPAAQSQRPPARSLGAVQRRHLQLLQTPQRHLLTPRRGPAMAITS